MENINQGKKNSKKTKTPAKTTKGTPDVCLEVGLEDPATTNRDKFQLKAKKMVLTYPNLPDKWNEEPHQKLEKVAQNLHRLCGKPPKSYIIALEHHDSKGIKQGAPHIHIAVELPDNENNAKSNWSFSGKSGLAKLDGLLDIGEGYGPKHGNYAACRKWLHSVRYLTKEGCYIVNNLDVEAVREAIQNKKAYGFEKAANDIMGGKTLVEVTVKNPGFAMQHLQKIEKFANFVDVQVKRPKLLPFYGVVIPNFTSSDYQVCCWLKDNLFTDRKHKQRQLFISGPTNVGKSYLWMTLMKYCRVFIMPYESFACDYTEEYDLVVFDEFVGQKEVSFMNSFCEGTPMQILRKGKQPHLKVKNVPVIVCSNKRIEELYPNVKNEHPWLHEAFVNRFTEAVVTTRMNVKFKEEPLIFELEELIPVPDYPEIRLDNPEDEEANMETRHRTLLDETEALLRCDEVMEDLEDFAGPLPLTLPSKKAKKTKLKKIRRLERAIALHTDQLQDKLDGMAARHVDEDDHEAEESMEEEVINEKEDKSESVEDESSEGGFIKEKKKTLPVKKRKQSEESQENSEEIQQEATVNKLRKLYQQKNEKK